MAAVGAGRGAYGTDGDKGPDFGTLLESGDKIFC